MVFVAENYRDTWKSIDVKSTKLAEALMYLGVSKGDRVAAWAPNTPEWPLVQFACAKAGFIFVTMNPMYTQPEAEYACDLVDVKAIFAPPSFVAQNYCDHLSQMKTKPKFMIQTGSDELRQPFSIKFDDVIQGSVFGGELKDSQITSDTINMIQFTSGTTGRPKAATLTNKNLVNNVIGFGKRTGMCLPEQIYNVNVPLFHCFGSVLGTLSSLIFQNTCVFPAPKFSAQAGIDATFKEKCTVQMGTPTMYMDIFALSSEPKNAQKLKTSKMGVIAGSLCPPEVAKEANSLGKVAETYHFTPVFMGAKQVSI